jgi:hypothetical protein
MPELKFNLNTEQVDSLLEQLRYGKYTAENWDIDLLKGINGEAQVLDILAGKIEVKTDFKAFKTGNLAIEIESYGKPSGIQTSEAHWWLFNIRIPDKEPLLLIITLERLRQICTKYMFQGKTCMGGDKMKSKLVIIPITEVITG